MKNAILSIVATILVVGCSQEPTVQTPPQEHPETIAELKARAEAVFNARQAWIKENVWTTKQSMSSYGELEFVIVNKSPGTLKHYSIMYSLMDDSGRELESDIPEDGRYVNIPSGSVSEQRINIHSKIPIQVASTYRFQIMGVTMEGVTLPGTKNIPNFRKSVCYLLVYGNK